jgi:hypothetical protein
MGTSHPSAILNLPATQIPAGIAVAGTLAGR